MKFIIKDWSGNHLFIESRWDTYEGAEDFLAIYFDKEGMDYDEWRGEYYIEEFDEIFEYWRTDFNAIIARMGELGVKSVAQLYRVDPTTAIERYQDKYPDWDKAIATRFLQEVESVFKQINLN